MFDSTDTTDVQRVKAILSILPEAKSIIVCCQCDFITGSNAKGCKVVLVGQSLNHPMSFTKQNISTTSIMGNYSLWYEKFCKHDIVQVMAYDIEENGIEGNVAVPGSVEWSSNSENNLQQLCKQTSGMLSCLGAYNMHCQCLWVLVLRRKSNCAPFFLTPAPTFSNLIGQ